MSKTRTFLAVTASADVVEQAERLIGRLRRVADAVKWVDPANLHWTLHFLGELDDQEIYDVCQAAERASRQVPAFVLDAVGVGAFPSSARPRTLWIGASEGATEMCSLHAALDGELKPLGFRGETRRFVPHLTLGRAGRNLRAAEATALTEQLAQLQSVPAGRQQVDAVTVYASRLRREGAEYTVLAEIELA